MHVPSCCVIHKLIFSFFGCSCCRRCCGCFAPSSSIIKTWLQAMTYKCVYLSANRFSMAWETGIQVPFPFFVFAWHWKTDFNFAFCFSFSPKFEKRFCTSYFVFLFSHHFEKRVSISAFVFCFRITLKSGYEFRFCFSFSHYFEKRIWISFLVFSSLWKTDLNFVCHFCMTWKRDHCTSPVIWSPGHPLGVDRAFTFYVTESKWIFLSPGPRWVVNFPPRPPPQWYVLHTHGTPFSNNG